jgi:ribosome-associated translation inhibitor RaiA
MSRRFTILFAVAAWIAICFAANLALAQAPEDMTFKLSVSDLQVISEALSQMPYRASNQTINKLQSQINKQQTDAQAARDAKLIEDAKKVEPAK